MFPLTLRLTKAQRLKTPAQFQDVYKSKQWGHSRLYSFNVLPMEASGQAAVLGVTVSKKVSKAAVDRNRIKRQIKEFYRHSQSDLNDAHLIITAKPACLKASDAERLESLSELWGKVMGWQRWHRRQLQKQIDEQC